MKSEEEKRRRKEKRSEARAKVYIVQGGESAPVVHSKQIQRWAAGEREGESERKRQMGGGKGERGGREAQAKRVKMCSWPLIGAFQSRHHTLIFVFFFFQRVGQKKKKKGTLRE